MRGETRLKLFTLVLAFSSYFYVFEYKKKKEKRRKIQMERRLVSVNVVLLFVLSIAAFVFFHSIKIVICFAMWGSGDQDADFFVELFDDQLIAPETQFAKKQIHQLK